MTDLDWPTSGIAVPRLSLLTSAAELRRRFGNAFLAANFAADVRDVGVTAEESVAAMSRASDMHHVVVAWHLKLPRRSIGRSGPCGVVIPHPSVSRLHALLVEDAHGFLVSDAGSANWTSVDGVAVPKRGDGAPLRLRPNSELRLGDVVTTFIDAAALAALVAAAGTRSGER